jgi:hypothetical protein
MVLCALLDAGESIVPGIGRRLLDELALLPLAHRGARVEEVTRAGIRALRLVDPPGDGHHDPASPGHSGPTRSLAEIRAILDRADLSPLVHEAARQIFDRLATAEARVHGRTPEDVRLHEAGADDAVFDVVGVCLALEALGIDRVESSAIPMGGREPGGATGVPETSPPLIPAPATAELLRGSPVSGPPPFGEATTPTGAALVTALAGAFGPAPSMRVEAVGYGAGSRDPDGIPNVVRVLVGEAEDDATGEAPPGSSIERLVVMEANVDDLSPQLVADAAATLLEAGALDSWVAPVVMKKGRPGFLLGALAAPEQADALRRVFFETTTTLGVREHPVERTALARRFDTVTVRGAPVRVKFGLLDGTDVTATPEHEDLVALARATGRSVRSLETEARDAWRAGHGSSSGDES